MADTTKTDEELTFEHLCRIILEDWPLRQDEVSPDVREYQRRLLSALTSELGIEWSDDWRPVHFRLNEMPMVLQSMPRNFLRIAHPYSNYLEYSFLPGEREVWLRHRSRFGGDDATRKQAWVGLFRDLMLLRWPEAVHRRSSWARLQACTSKRPSSPASGPLH